MRAARPILKLARLDSSLLVALAVFIPLLSRTKDVGLSLGRAAPLLFISICTFIANDLDDIEKDRVNHPERPLPSGHIKPSFAAVLYFICLTLSLFTIKFYIRTNTAFLYYSLLTLSISYGYVVDSFPGLKSFYVAGMISVPVLIVAAFYPDEEKLYLVAGSVFFFVLGREWCMDFVDRPGDAVSFMHRIGSRPLAIAALSLQAMGLLLLSIQADGPWDFLGLLLIIILLALSGLFWLKLANYKRSIYLMKVQLFVGLCFLI